jgi:FkbM family methyltransferase
MSRIFIDGGGNWKKIVDRYLALANFDKIYVFEPNPFFYNSYDYSNYELIKKAIWVENTKMPFYISKDTNQVASSLFENKFCKVENKLVSNYWEKTIEVECVDFSEWIKKNFTSSDDVTLKLDIEGAEFEVIDKMIIDDTIKMINKLYVEFHLDTCIDKKEAYEQIKNKLKDLNICVYNWD